MQSNIFYRGIKEFGVRGREHFIDKPINTEHKYTIDWNKDRIQFLIDNVIVRTYRKDGPEAISPIQRKVFYPNRPMKVQFALWSDPNNAWAGGAIKWPPGVEQVTAEYRRLEIQCYDDDNKFVSKWPLANNPDYRDTLQFQPIRQKDGRIPKEARPGFQGEIPFMTKKELDKLDPTISTNYTIKPVFKLHLPFSSTSNGAREISNWLLGFFVMIVALIC